MSKSKREWQNIHQSLEDSAAFQERFDQWLRLDGDCMVTSDWHIPGHSAEAAEKMLRIADHFGIHTLAVVGDFWDTRLVCPHPSAQRLNAQDAKMHLSIVRDVLRVLLQQFRDIYWCVGNHERWLLKYLEGRFGWEEAARLIGLDGHEWARIHLSDYAKMELDGWRLCHPDSYSQISPQVARRLAAKHRQNILNTHGHFLGWGFDTSGGLVCADIGGMFDVAKQDYVQMRETTHPHWNPGFAMLRRGYFYLFSLTPGITDWALWLKETQPCRGRASRSKSGKLSVASLSGCR